MRSRILVDARRTLQHQMAKLVRYLYRTLFSSGRTCADLAYCEKLEELYPGLFLGMYQFWCQKREEGP